MTVTLARPLDWRRLLIQMRLPLIAAATWALLLVEPRGRDTIIISLLNASMALDWELYVEAGRRVLAGLSLYDTAIETCGGCVYRHSPIIAWAFVAIAPLGLTLFRLASFAALLALPRPLMVASLLTWPFWYGLAMGQVLVFPFVLAVLALRGSRWAGIGFLVFATLMPRPLMLPVAIWLLWNRPDVRGPFLTISLVHAAVVIGGGYTEDWIRSLPGATSDMTNMVNYGPSRWLGVAWIAIGLPLAGLLYLRGHLGLASLAIAPYWLPYYLPFAFLPRVRERTVLRHAHDKRGEGRCTGARHTHKVDGSQAREVIRHR